MRLVKDMRASKRELGERFWPVWLPAGNRQSSPGSGTVSISLARPRDAAAASVGVLRSYDPPGRLDDLTVALRPRITAAPCGIMVSSVKSRVVPMPLCKR
jgi:hypothetical protein